MKVTHKVVSETKITVELDEWEAMVLAEITDYIGGSGAARDFTDNLGEQLADACRRKVTNRFVHKQKNYNGIWLYEVEREKA